MEMMKERFSKLLLGEDMSGSGKGVCTALAISNAITNLCGNQLITPCGNQIFNVKFIKTCVFFSATAFGQLWRLEPLPSEKKQMWQREMECLLCVSDHIVEFKPSWQTLADGSKLEVICQSFVLMLGQNFFNDLMYIIVIVVTHVLNNVTLDHDMQTKIRYLC